MTMPKEMTDAPVVVDEQRGVLRLAWQRVRNGEIGELPVVGGLILVSIIFQSLNHHFFTAGNLVNLLVQAAAFTLLGMAEVFVLLLGEIDLSAGYVAGVAGLIVAWLVRPTVGWPWWAAIIVALVATALIGVLHGTLFATIGLPSFVVTLGGQLFWAGVILFVLGNGGAILIQDPVINGIASATVPKVGGWVIMLVAAAVFGVIMWRGDERRRASGLHVVPLPVTVSKIAGVFIAAVALMLLVSIDRGVRTPLSGLPWVVLLVIAVLAIWTYVLGRRKFGLYVYAVGGNAEGARRAGINLTKTRILAFMLCSLTAGVAGIVYASRLRSVSTSIDGGTLVLYGIAGAVIGGTSLFGGRGKALCGVLGGLVIAAIDNGMGLLGFSAAAKDMVTALVLIMAVIIDSFARRRANS